MNKLYTTHQSEGSWKNYREKVFSQTGKVCKICFSKNHIHLHHKRYKTINGKSIVGKERFKHVIPLCSSCHAFWHKWHKHNVVLDKNIVKKTKELIKLGYSKDYSIRFAPIILDRYKIIDPAWGT